MNRCEHDLEITGCADCRPRPGQNKITAGASLASEIGPWFIAAYNGACSGCGEDIVPDDEIRADSQGGWERRECCGELWAAPLPPDTVRVPSAIPGLMDRTGRGSLRGRLAVADDWDSVEVNARIARDFGLGDGA